MLQESQNRTKEALIRCALYSLGLIVGVIITFMYMINVYQINCAEMLGLMGR
jgi:hypothetical protein